MSSAEKVSFQIKLNLECIFFQNMVFVCVFTISDMSSTGFIYATFMVLLLQCTGIIIEKLFTFDTPIGFFNYCLLWMHNFIDTYFTIAITHIINRNAAWKLFVATPHILFSDHYNVWWLECF